MRAEERQADIGRRPAEHVGEEQDAVPSSTVRRPFHRVVDRLDAHLGEMSTATIPSIFLR